MSSKIESHAQALLSSLDVFLVERIAFFDCAEAGILTDRPRSLCVHGRVRSTGVRKLARNFILKTLDVLCSVKRLDIQSLVKKSKKILQIYNRYTKANGYLMCVPCQLF